MARPAYSAATCHEAAPPDLPPHARGVRVSGGFLRGPAPSSSYSSSYAAGSVGQSRADEPAQTPQQRDEAHARSELIDANQLEAAAKQLDQVPAAEWERKRDQLATKVEAFAAGLQSRLPPTENADHDRGAAVEAVEKARETIEHAKRPRAVPPVAGEEEIEPQIAAKSIEPRAVIEWVASLSRSERQAVWHRYEQRNRADAFAVALSNYVGATRIANDLHGLARMTDRQIADWRAHNAGAAAPEPVEPFGQSKPLDPLGQSRPLDPAGQSFADPTRDADHDGRADLFNIPDPTTQPSAAARQLAASVTQAIGSANYIAAVLLPTYADALDALDLAAVGDAAASTIAEYKHASTVRAQLRAQLADSDGTTEHAADHGLLSPLRGALDTALAVAEAELASGLGVQRFRGRAVMPGTAPLRLPTGEPVTAAVRLTQEAGAAQGLIATIDQVAALLPTAADASAADVSAPEPHGARTAAEKIRIWAGRPVHLAFLKAALSDLGIWQQVEHATIPGDGRTLGQLDKDTNRNAARFGAMSDLGAYDADMAATFLIGGQPSREDVAQVLDLIDTAAPDALGPILEDLDRRGLLEGFAARLKYDEAKRLHDTARDASHARSILRDRYGQDPHTGDNTVSNGLRHIPLIGGALDETLNVFTFGFLHEHDDAHRRMQSGEMTEDEYVDASNHALLKATAVGAISTVTGGAASAYVEGLTASVAARGVAGRIAATTASGAAGGAVGNMGARLGSDAVDGELSSLGAYGHDAAMGGAIGGGIGFGASSLTAAAKYLPENVKTPIHRLLSRLPSLADDSEVFGAIRSLGEHDAHALATFTADAARVTELAALRVVTLSSEAWQAVSGSVRKFGANTRALGTAARAKVSQFGDDFGDGFGPQFATANGAPARFRFTAEAAQPLNVPGPDGPAMHILKAERLGDDLASHADDFADEFGGRDAVDLMEGNEPRRASFADESPELVDDFADDLADDATEIGLADPTPSGRPGNRRRHVDEAHTPDEFSPDQGFSVTDNPHEVWAVADEGARITDRHHIFPQSAAEKAWFAERGINVDDFTVDLSKLDHQIIHGGEQTLARKHWPTREWRTRIMNDLRVEEIRLAAEYGIPGRKLTPDEIWGVANDLRAKFKIDHLPLIPYHAP